MTTSEPITYYPGDRVVLHETFRGEVVQYSEYLHEVVVRWDTHFGAEVTTLAADRVSLERREDTQ
jgi:hypothetical protein